MALVKRLVKGDPLTAAEMDGNLDYLEELALSGSSGTSVLNEFTASITASVNSINYSLGLIHESTASVEETRIQIDSLNAFTQSVDTTSIDAVQDLIYSNTQILGITASHILQLDALNDVKDDLLGYTSSQDVINASLIESNTQILGTTASLLLTASEVTTQVDELVIKVGEIESFTSSISTQAFDSLNATVFGAGGLGSNLLAYTASTNLTIGTFTDELEFLREATSSLSASVDSLDDLLQIVSASVYDISTGSVGGGGGIVGPNISGSFTGSVSASFIDFSGITTPTQVDGRLYYNTGSGTLTTFTDVTGVSINLGTDSFVKVINKSGGQLSKGEVVYLSGSFNGLPQVWKAQAQDNTSVVNYNNRAIGIASQNILTDEIGFIPKNGTIVGGLDTQNPGFNAGDIVFLDTFAGGLVNTPPSSPNDKIKVGQVLIVGATDGSILIDIQDVTDLGNLSSVSSSLATRITSIEDTTPQTLQIVGTTLSISDGNSVSLAGIAGGGGSGGSSIWTSGSQDPVSYDHLYTQNNLKLTGSFDIQGNLTVDGNSVFGNSTLDLVGFSASLNSNIIPNVNNTYTLGSDINRFSELHVTTLNAYNGIISSSGQIADLGEGIISSSEQLDGSTFGNIIASGSFSGSFFGDGTGLTFPPGFGGASSYTDLTDIPEGIISSSLYDSYNFALTGSTNTFYADQTFNGDVSIVGAVTASAYKIENAGGDPILQSATNIYLSASDAGAVIVKGTVLRLDPTTVEVLGTTPTDGDIYYDNVGKGVWYGKDGTWTNLSTGSGAGVSSYLDLTNIPNGIISSSAQIANLGADIVSSSAQVDSLISVGSIDNNQLANSSITIKGVTVSLGDDLSDLDTGLISSSQQITDLGFLSGSAVTADTINFFTTKQVFEDNLEVSQSIIQGVYDSSVVSDPGDLQTAGYSLVLQEPNSKLRVGPNYLSGGDRDYVDVVTATDETSLLTTSTKFTIKNSNVTSSIVFTDGSVEVSGSFKTSGSIVINLGSGSRQPGELNNYFTVARTLESDRTFDLRIGDYGSERYYIGTNLYVSASGEWTQDQADVDGWVIGFKNTDSELTSKITFDFLESGSTETVEAFRVTGDGIATAYSRLNAPTGSIDNFTTQTLTITGTDSLSLPADITASNALISTDVVVQNSVTVTNNVTIGNILQLEPVVALFVTPEAGMMQVSSSDGGATYGIYFYNGTIWREVSFV